LTSFATVACGEPLGCAPFSLQPEPRVVGAGRKGRNSFPTKASGAAWRYPCHLALIGTLSLPFGQPAPSKEGAVTVAHHPQQCAIPKPEQLTLNGGTHPHSPPLPKGGGGVAAGGIPATAKLLFPLALSASAPSVRLRLPAPSKEGAVTVAHHPQQCAMPKPEQMTLNGSTRLHSPPLPKGGGGVAAGGIPATAKLFFLLRCLRRHPQSGFACQLPLKREPWGVAAVSSLQSGSLRGWRPPPTALGARGLPGVGRGYGSPEDGGATEGRVCPVGTCAKRKTTRSRGVKRVQTTAVGCTTIERPGRSPVRRPPRPLAAGGTPPA